jgi:hypothetical protein
MHHLERQVRVQRGDAFLEKVLDGFDVVIGLGLELLDATRVGQSEVLVE